MKSKHLYTILIFFVSCIVTFNSWVDVKINVNLLNHQSEFLQVYYDRYFDDDGFNEKNSLRLLQNANSDTINEVTIPILTKDIRLDLGDAKGAIFTINDLSIFGINIFKYSLTDHISSAERIDDIKFITTNSDPFILLDVGVPFAIVTIIYFSVIFSLLFLSFLVVRLSILKGLKCASCVSLLKLLLVSFSFLLFWAFLVIEKLYGSVDLSQILFHMKLENSSFNSPNANITFILGIYFFLISISVYLLIDFCIKKYVKIELVGSTLSLMTFFICLTPLYYIDTKLNVVNYFSSAKTDLFEYKYASLDFDSIDSQDSNNLIVIFMESMESGYSDQNVFGEDLVKELTQLKKEGISFQNYQKTPGSKYTADGIAAQLCGVPIVRMGFDIHQKSDEYNVLLANSPSIFNVLKNEGYHTGMLFGTPESFTQLGNFFKVHGIDDVRGAFYWMEHGYEKDEGFSLFNDRFIYARLQEWLNENGSKKFAVGMMTIDTHFPNGYVPIKYKKYNDARDSIIDASRQVYDFISWAKNQKWFDKTTIVIVGDHPWLNGPNKMSDFTRLQKKQEAFNLILNSRIKKDERVVFVNDGFSPMDIAPTILNAMGITFYSSRNGEKVSNALGLGVSLYGNTKTLVGEMGLTMFNDELNKQSDFYYNLF